MMMIVNLESWKVMADDDAEINWRQVFPRSSSMGFERHPPVSSWTTSPQRRWKTPFRSEIVWNLQLSQVWTDLTEDSLFEMSAQSSLNWIPSPSHIIDRLVRVRTSVHWNTRRTPEISQRDPVWIEFCILEFGTNIVTFLSGSILKKILLKEVFQRKPTRTRIRASRRRWEGWREVEGRSANQRRGDEPFI